MSQTKIVTCSCVHEFQDKKHGKQRRVANATKGKKFRCTVCGKEHD